jgi:hypothetical protein
MTDTCSAKHPHEPQIPPTLDDEGRCLICVLTYELAETKRLLAEARDDVAELLERIPPECWHSDDRIECHVALLSRIDAALNKEQS